MRPYICVRSVASWRRQPCQRCWRGRVGKLLSLKSGILIAGPICVFILLYLLLYLRAHIAMSSVLVPGGGAKGRG